MSNKPELPNPAMSVNPNGSLSCIAGEWFSKEQMLAYGEACAKAEAEALRGVVCEAISALTPEQMARFESAIAAQQGEKQ